MKEWILGVQPKIYVHIINKRKTIEGRTPDSKIPEKNYRLLKKEDILVFLKEDESKEITKYKIKHIKHYSNVKDMLLKEGLNKFLPTVDTIQEGIKEYDSFPNYSNRIKKFGIYAITIGDKIR